MTRTFSLATTSLGWALLALIGSTQTATAATPEELWQVIRLGGQSIGYGWSVSEPIEVDGKKVWQIRSETRLKFKRFGQTLQITEKTTTQESDDGHLLSFVYEMQNPPASPTRMTGKIREGKLTVTTDVDGKLRRSVQDWNDNIRSPAWIDRSLSAVDWSKTKTQSFEAYVPQLQKTAKIDVTAEGREEAELMDGQKVVMQRLTTKNSLTPGIVTAAWIDHEGKLKKTATALLGLPMETFTVSREVALKSVTNEELDLAVQTLVPVKAINSPHRAAKRTYRIHDPLTNPTLIFSEQPNQTFRVIDPLTVDMTVSAVPLPQPGTSTESPGAEYLGASQFLQTGDEKVVQLAKEVAGDGKNPSAVAIALERLVHQRLTSKNFSTALGSAAEVARTLQGDCTEHAVLLAALLRVHKIPSRLAAGLVYIGHPEPAFGGHMWTEAWLGNRWVPLDATLAQGGAGPAHLTVAVSSFSDDGPAPMTAFIPLLLSSGKLSIKVVE